MTGIPDPGAPSGTFAALERRPVGFTDATALPLHKRPNGLDGYLYAVALSTGLVKVGRTVNPRGRLGSHISHAHKVGVDVLDLWLSPRHQNYAANERELIRRLGTAERGSEYFRREYADVVRIAESLSYDTLTDDERQARDARHREDADQRYESVFGPFRPLSGADGYREALIPPGYQTVLVPADVQAWALQLIFSTGDLPAPRPDGEDVDTAEIILVAERIAASSMGGDVEDILDYSFLDVVLHLANSAVRGAWLQLKIRALEAGRRDLTAPGYFNLDADVVDEYLASREAVSKS